MHLNSQNEDIGESEKLVGKESEVLKSHRTDHVFEEGKNGYCMQRPTDRPTD